MDEPYVLDASVLIDLKHRNKLKYLNKLINDGRVIVPAFVLNKLKKAPSWRKWVEDKTPKLRQTLNTPQEHVLFAKLMREHGHHIDADDLMAITIACCRKLPLVMRDNPAETVAHSLGVRCITDADSFLQEAKAGPQLHLL